MGPEQLAAAAYPRPVAWWSKLLHAQRSLFSPAVFRRDARPLASGTRADSLDREPTGGRWVNYASGLGGPHDRAQADEYVEGVPVDRVLADALIQYNGVGRRVIAREPEDCTRQGYELKDMDPGLAQELEAMCDGDGAESLGALRAIRESRMWARAFGGGAIIPLLDDAREPHEPIDWGGIRAVRGLLVVDRWELPVVDYGRDPREPRTFAKPRTYNLQPAYGGVSYRIHADRVIRMGGAQLPRRIMLRRQGWDGSVFDLIYAQLRAYGSSHAYAAEALSLLTQGVLKSPSLDAALETADGPAIVQNRLEAMRLAMGLFGEMAISGQEDYQIHARPLTGLGDAIKAAVDALVMVSDMPRAVLNGEMPGGLTRSSVSPELLIWYDHCASMQPEHYTPALRRILDLVLRSHEGPTGGRVPTGWSIEWNPLVQESEDQKAARRLTNAQARAADVATMVVSPAEVRAGDRELQELYGLDPVDTKLEPAVPGIEPDAPDASGLGGDVSSVAALALNGAQAQALVAIVQSVMAGEIPRDSGVAIINEMLPSSPNVGERVLASAGQGVQPTAVVGADDDATELLGALTATGESTDPVPDDLVDPRDIAERLGLKTMTVTTAMKRPPGDPRRLRWWMVLGKRRVSMREALALVGRGGEE